MPFQMVTGDIAQIRADALVNAANPRLQEGGGVCGALFRGAGRSQMQAACAQIGGCSTGQAVITPAFGLPAKYVIHAVGPVYLDGNQGEEALLRSAYQSALRLAEEHQLRSVAFPLLSAGIYGYPRQEALRVAKTAIRDFLNQQEEELEVTLVLYDKAPVHLDRSIREQLDRLLHQADLNQAAKLMTRAEYSRNQRYLDSLGADLTVEMAATREEAPLPAGAPRGLDALISRMDEGFSATLLRLIDSKGMTDAQVYKRANLDRKHFSKIRVNPHYTPGKLTVLALCIALELNREQTEDLLAQAGFALSPSHKQDIIIGYFIDQGIYQVDAINLALFEFDQGLLGAS